MDHLFDEFSKSLAESVPRRESLRRLGAVFAGAVLSPLGLETAWAAGADPCKTFCKCSNKTQQSQCLTACRACNSDTSRTCGTCGSYVCCTAGQSCCSGHCTSLQYDVQNCGGCGKRCGAPGVNESVACISGLCTYDCIAGASDCNGTCTFLDSDPDNCGACGNVCPAQAPNCSGGICSESTCRGNCPEGWCGGDGCGGECGCPSGFYCEYNGWCYAGCSPDSPYYPNC